MFFKIIPKVGKIGEAKSLVTAAASPVAWLANMCQMKDIPALRPGHPDPAPLRFFSGSMAAQLPADAPSTIKKISE